MDLTPAASPWRSLFGCCGADNGENVSNSSDYDADEADDDADDDVGPGADDSSSDNRFLTAGKSVNCEDSNTSGDRNHSSMGNGNGESTISSDCHGGEDNDANADDTLIDSIGNLSCDCKDNGENKTNISSDYPGGDDDDEKDTFIDSFGDFAHDLGSDPNGELNEELDAAALLALRSNRIECDVQAQSRGSGRRRNIRRHILSKSSLDQTSGSDDTKKHSLTSLRRTGMSSDLLSSQLSGWSQEFDDLSSKLERKDWLRSFKNLDPRYQILEFFNDLSRDGVVNFESNGLFARSFHQIPMILRGFIRSGIFSVWRPTSNDAIRKMITGEGTGKGLDIKGKSAKCGVYSGFVPFLQIHENGHKRKLGTMRAGARVRVFYPNASSRDKVASRLNILGASMARKASEARNTVEKAESSRDLAAALSNAFGGSISEIETDAVDKVETEEARRSKMIPRAAGRQSIRSHGISMLKGTGNFEEALTTSHRCFMEDPSIRKIDEYAESSGVYGLDIPEKVFWEGYVVQNDITREKQYETGRPSMPEFQQMNLETLRSGHDMSMSNAGTDVGPRPVLWHGGCGQPGEEAPELCNPMCPIGLLMAYEEDGKVTPVVSDFDCFLLGTRGVKFEKPLGKQELSMLSWCINEIEGVLAKPANDNGWTKCWLEVKKKHIYDHAHKKMPPFGYADPRSYSIMTGAVQKMKSNGAVRHGPECFNYSFPQELDDQYLVISDKFTAETGIPWRYTNAEGLIDILCNKVDLGFTFPLNPKWVLCDPGWKRVYDKLMASQKPNVQDSMSIWYPNGIRDRINEISAKYPQGFVCSNKGGCQSSGVEADLALLSLRRYEIRQNSQRKFRAAISKTNVSADFAKFLVEVQGSRTSSSRSIQI